MFVIACRYTGTDHIFKSVNSMIQFHPGEEILVVDSDSEDKSYFDKIKDLPNVIIADVANRHYSTGAIQHAYDFYPRDYYFAFQDSMWLGANIDFCKNFKLSVWAYFYMVPYGLPEEEWARQQIATHTKFTIPPAPYQDCWGIAGGLMFCHREVLDNLYSTGFKNILEDTKDRNFAMERLHGLALTQLGYNIKENSIWGDWQRADLSRGLILKEFLNRA